MNQPKPNCRCQLVPAATLRRNAERRLAELREMDRLPESAPIVQGARRRVETLGPSQKPQEAR